jgi:membrane fusion protein (multidrug efflux system)
MKSHPCLLLTSVLTLAGLTACGPKPGAGGPGAGAMGMMAIQVVLADVVRQPVTETQTLVSDIAANESVEIKSETDGMVQEIPFTEGQEVKKDQLLVRLDESKAASVLAEVEANSNLSASTFARAKQLFQDRLISQQEYDQASATYERAHASVELMKRQLRDCRILAPFDGTVGARLVSPGQVISRNTLLTTLVDADPVKAEFYVPERYLSQVQIGQNIEISVATYPGQKFTGRVYFVSPQVDLKTRRALVKAEIPNTDRRLKPGMFGNLILTLKLRDDAILVPEIALMYDGDHARVFVATTTSSNQVAMLRPVTVGLRLPGRAEIVDGLQPGEKVVTEGTQKLVPGMPIRSGPPPGMTPPPAAGATNPAPNSARK